jgi:hypothetical protein
MVCVGDTCYDAAIMNARQTEKQIRSGVDSTTAAGDAGMRLFSVGHSNHDWPTFVALLRRVGIAALADVRSSPYSRWLPHFNKGALENGLREQGIAYVFLGDLLGGRPGSRTLYDDEGCLDFERVRATAEFQRGLEQLTRHPLGSPLAFLCSEEDPLDCHRGLMIAPALGALGFSPNHLRKDGSIETNEQMEKRLLRETGVGIGLLDGLFAAMLTDEDRRALVAEAYRRRGRRKAYRLREDEERE